MQAPAEQRRTSERDRIRAVVLLLAVGTLLIAAAAGHLAIGWYGHPVAGMLVDAGAHVSNIGAANWESKAHGLGFPDRVVGVNGESLEPCGRRCGVEFNEHIARLAREGHRAASVHLETAQGERRVLLLEIRPLSAGAWWAVAAALLFVGVLWAGAGLLTWWAAPFSPLARATGKFGTLCGVFMITLFDFHSTGQLVPLFLLCFGAMPFTWIVLALRLPDDAVSPAKLRWIERAADLGGIALASVLIATYFSGHSMRSLQTVTTTLLGVCSLTFNVVFVVRFLRSRGRRRRTMRALALALVPPYVIIGLFLFLFEQHLQRLMGDLFVYPVLGFAPVAAVWVFIRYDLWGSRALLSRLLTRIALGAGVCALAVAGGTSLAVALDVPFRQALVAATAGGLIAAVTVALALTLSDRFLFPARAAYKPSVAQLSAELTAITSPGEVARAVERTVRRWLACERAELALLEPEPIATGDEESHTTSETGGVVLQVLFAAQRLGELRVGPKPGGALFTSEDVELLETIADQGGLALAHAHAYQELERRRREQAAAWRGEREALVETVAGEIAHEVRHPINFFRSIFEHGSVGELDAEELEVGREEVERLERLFKGLRRLAAQHVERREVRVIELCERAERLLRDALGERELELEVGEEDAVRCDPDKSIQIFVNLLSNALEASGAEGRVGVRLERKAGGAEIQVWDDGPGFVGDPSRLFAPWYTTKPRGTGLGLAITHRLVRAHDWKIRASRRDGRTVFSVSVRAADLVGSTNQAQVA